MPTSDNPQPAPVADDALTIDELAERVGMTVRNLREWRTLGLLPRAEMRGRVGYYAPAVVERVKRIQKLHAEGFTLELISRMLDAGGDAGDEVMRLAATLRAPVLEDAPSGVGVGESAAGWGTLDPDHLRRASELGLIRERADGSYEFATERLARIGASLQELGLSVGEILDATARIRDHADGIAEIFEQVWLEQVWEPFIEAGMPEEELARIQETAGRVKPLALDAVIALFTIAMDAQIEQGIARELERASDRDSRKAAT